MELSLSILLFCPLAFMLAGFVDSIAGGGGLISVPALLLAGVPPHMALGSGKFASTLGSLSALWTFARHHLVVTRIAPLGFVCSFLGAVGGSWLAMQIESELLGRILVFLLPAGLLLSLLSGRSHVREGALPERGLRLRVALMGCLIGAYDGFFGPGTGSFFIIAQHVLLRMGLVHASATAKVFNLASNMGALLTFASGGVVLYALAVPCALANIVGNQIGVRLAIRVGARAVRGLLYVTLSLLTLTLIYRFFL